MSRKINFALNSLCLSSSVASASLDNNSIGTGWRRSLTSGTSAWTPHASSLGTISECPPAIVPFYRMVFLSRLWPSLLYVHSLLSFQCRVRAPSSSAELLAAAGLLRPIAGTAALLARDIGGPVATGSDELQVARPLPEQLLGPRRQPRVELPPHLVRRRLPALRSFGLDHPRALLGLLRLVLPARLGRGGRRLLDCASLRHDFPWA